MTNISIAMATYNGARYLREQLASIRAQTVAPLELVVGDDGSTDDTMAILDAFAQDAPFPVHVHRNRPNLGFGDNFIETAKRCRGDWIAFCDQDDVWLPHKLERCAAEIARGPADLRLIVHDAHVTDEALAIRHKHFGFAETRDHAPLTLRPDWNASGMAQVFSAKLVRDLDTSPRVSFSADDFKEPHDFWIALLANATGTVRHLAEPLLLYRRHGGNVSGIHAHTVTEWVQLAARNHGGYFADRAELLGRIATRFDSLANTARDGELAARLRAASVRIGAYADVVRRRAEAYAAPSRLAGYKALAGLLKDGAYTKGLWRIGLSRFAKDVVSVTI